MVTNTLLLFFLLTQSLQISNESPFEDFDVAIWPEYDHSGIIMIYTGSIKKDHLPLHLEVIVPEKTDFAFAVGQHDTINSLQPVPIVEKNNSRWASTTFVKDNFQLELYFNPFDLTELRKGDIEIQLNHPLDDYHVAVQHPLAAEEFIFPEPGAEMLKDEHGLIYSRVHLPALPAGQIKTVSFSYYNRGGKLSVALLQEMLGSSQETFKQQSNQTQKGIDRYRLPTYQPLAVLLAVSMIIGFFYWKTNYRTVHKEPSQNGKRSCSECGIKVGENDRFCLSCGQKLI